MKTARSTGRRLVPVLALLLVRCVRQEIGRPEAMDVPRATPCTAGLTVSCPCLGGAQGVQTCDPANGFFGACVCAPLDAGTALDGAVGADVPRTTDASSTADGSGVLDTVPELDVTPLLDRPATDGPDGSMDAMTSDAAACLAGTHHCLGVCVADTAPEACGPACVRCPVPVGGTATCERDTCGSVCPAGATLCGSACVVLASDGSNCGGCGRACSAGEACQAGICTLVCPAGSSICGGRCVPLGGPCRSAGTGGCAQDGTTVCVNGSLACSAVPRTTGVCSAPTGGTCNAAGTCSCSSGTHDCGERCASDASPTTCGASCTPCPAPVGGTATCTSGFCESSCPTGQAACGGVCRDVTRDPTNCGQCGRICIAPENGSTDCVTGSCRASCRTGFLLVADRCLAPVVRPLSPLPTAAVSHRRPVLRWTLSGGADGARVEVCRDRACASVVTTIDSVGASGSPASDLPAGTLFWRAFARVGSVTAASPAPTWQFRVGTRSAPGPNGSRGTSLDINGDGYADLAAGAPRAANGAGRVYVYLGSASGIGAAPSFTLTGPDGPGGAAYGFATASAGDLNGDGFADLVVGRQGAANSTGRVHVYFGSRAGLPTDPSVSITGPDGPGAEFGNVVVGAGDLDGDGYGDLVVGAHLAMGGTGRVHFYPGSATGPATTPTRSLNAPDGAGSGFGNAVAALGDVEGDGFADIAIGAHTFLGRTGAVYVYSGSARGVSMAPAVSLYGTDGPSGHFGWTLASSVDLQGDGFPDLVVGAVSDTNGQGRVRVFPGSARGVATSPSVVLEAPAGRLGDPHFGGTVAGSGDLDGDGFDDLTVSAGVSAAFTGRVYVYPGSATGIAATPTTQINGVDGIGGGFGSSLASGDLNGDMLSDLVVGAEYAIGATGRVHLFLGRASGFLGSLSTSRTGPDGGSFGSSVVALRDSALGGVRRRAGQGRSALSNTHAARALGAKSRL